jgi:uncharacterized protein (TIGR03000 family)
MVRPAAAVFRPAPSAWPAYQAARIQSGNYGAGTQAQSSYSAPGYNPGRYARVYEGWQNPWYGAEYHNVQHQPSAYPYGEPRLYPYSHSYLYPYNYQDATTVPYYEVGSGGGRYQYSLQPEQQNSQPSKQQINPWLPDPVDSFQQGAGGTRSSAPEAASVTVVVPDAQAVVTFQGQQTVTKGTNRIYKTPPLAPGARYEYDVVARWRQNGTEVERRRTVDIAASSSVTIDFTKPDARGR